MSKFTKKKSGEVPPVSTASLPDIIFMLLFFFMTVTESKDSDLMVQNKLPVADQIQKLDKDILLQINNNKSYWENIKGMRNRLIHEYWGTSIEMLYEISVYELDELLSYILKIRDEMESLN